MTNACFSYFYSFVASSSWVVVCMVDGEAASHRSPGPLIARPGPGARCPTAARISISIAVQFGAQTSAAWRGRVRGAASCRAVAGFLERALNLVPHSPPSGRCSHQLPSPALCCTVLYCTVLYCTVLYCSHQLTSQALLILNFCEAQARVRQGWARDGC